MQDHLGERLKKLNKKRVRRTQLISILLVLSLVVSLDVFWVLRRPGLTLAGDADCGILEHIHDSECGLEETPCIYEEHVHSVLCYSDPTADKETPLEWQNMFSNYPYTGDLQKDIVGIAKTQVGYTESTQNFEVGGDGVRRGYTRYGDWYGAPYTDWSAVFVSFCLNYAGAEQGEYPHNTGATSMAESWKKLGRYALAGEYEPTAGDLVFFKNNTVGIVSEVYNSSICVIMGDKEDSVRTAAISVSDDSVVGWGLTATIKNETSTDIIPDVSNGPIVSITEGKILQSNMTGFSLRASRTVKDIVTYLNQNGGSYFLTLLDKNNHELPKDGAGNFIVQSGIDYNITLSFSSPYGFAPGTYQYKLPDGLIVNGGKGDFILKDNTNVGEWVVSDDGLITLMFNEQMNSRTDITISATMGVKFKDSEEPIDFDGKITVSVEKPPPQQYPTKLNKWGVQGAEGNINAPDPTKLYWTIQIDGDKDSQIPGSTLMDRVVFGQWSKEHYFTPSDIENGLTIGVSEPDPVTGAEKAWHSWKVNGDDPNLYWTEIGWSYKIPETAVCQWCGAVELGNDGWKYTVKYTSTPTPTGVAGAFGYENEAEVDRQYAYAWTDFIHGEIHGIVSKTGSFVADAEGGGFLWELQAMIPGIVDGQKADHFWFIMDYMDIRDSGGSFIEYITNDANNSSVTANYKGTTINVPHIHNATANDPYAWHNYWEVDHNDGIFSGRQLNLLCRCNCTEENCPLWSKGKCGSEYWYEADDGEWYNNGFCQCWTAEENTTFTFVYKTDDISIIEKHGGVGNSVRNEAVLYNKPNGAPDGAIVSSTKDSVIIPGVFKKELTHDFDGYTANYKITVNEAKQVITNGTPLSIHDEMSKTLAYISGSLVITAEDADGKLSMLVQDKDYTVTYDGTGNATDAQGTPVHVLDIVILHPQPVMYILDYDTTLIMPENLTGGVKYSNSATVTLWGKDITDVSTEKVYADINIAAKNFTVELQKTSAVTGEPLAGATFGVYNDQGGLIDTDVTDENGEIFFKTNVIEGIILREHVLYYMQELKAPPGYQLDDTKYWFCFCDKKEDTCVTCTEVMAGKDAVRIPFEKIGIVHAENININYDLPATGGSGIYPLMLTSVILIVIPFVYISVPRRKRERREGK